MANIRRLFFLPEVVGEVSSGIGMVRVLVVFDANRSGPRAGSGESFYDLNDPKREEVIDKAFARSFCKVLEKLDAQLQKGDVFIRMAGGEYLAVVEGAVFPDAVRLIANQSDEVGGAILATPNVCQFLELKQQ